MHRLAQVFGTATLIALVAACHNPTHHEDAAPTGPTSSAPAAGGSAGGAPAATPTPRASSGTSPATRTTSGPTSRPTHVDPAELTIHPDHIGPLRIGMSLKAAKATGLIVVRPGQSNAGPDSCVSADWTGQSDDAWMVFNGKYGLRALDSFGDQRTPEGIRRGSTLAAVKRAYPHLTWRMDGDETSDARRVEGDALVDAVKGDGAHYRINIQKGKVTDVQLESDRAGCYE
jgi:hypothetical protein